MLTRYANKFEVGFFMFYFLFFSMTTLTYRSEVNLKKTWDKKTWEHLF